MSTKEYPKELFETDYALGSVDPDSRAAQHRKMGFDCAQRIQEQSGNWHDLTAAIKRNDPVDFEKLDGRKVRFTDGGASIESTLERDEEFLPGRPTAWMVSNDNDSSYLWRFFSEAWNGKHGWTLYLDGEIPMKKQTADELPFGTNFKDSHGHGYVVVAYGKVQALYGNYNVTMAKNIVVAEVLGMYGQKESE